MRIVLDTNVLLSSFARKSPFRPIFDALLKGKYDLFVSNDMLREYEEIIARKTTPQIADNVLELLSNLQNVHTVEVYYYWDVITADPDDNKFVDCAVVATADYLVSNDKHFQVLKDLDFPPLNLISSRKFLRVLSEM